jgi:uncharacterized membrane protein YozB (DUF420 family)
MERSSSEAVGASSPLKRAAQVLILAAIGGLVTYTASRALWSAFANDDFPESLAVKVELLPLIFPVHMITGGLALLLLPLAFALRHRPTWHRPVGRLVVADVLVSGLTAFPVAWAAPVTTWSAAGFTAQATTWLVLLVLGIRAIRQRRIAAHRTCMLLMAATTSGAVFFRVYLALWAMVGDRRLFDAFYACDAWIAWLLPLILTALAIRRSAARQASSSTLASPCSNVIGKPLSPQAP